MAESGDKKKEKRQISIYMKNMLVKQIHLPLIGLGNNLNYILETIISKQIGGKCVQEGYIKPNSIKILTYSNGNINGNYIVFKVIFECLVCSPVEGMHINAVVKNITKAGIRAETLDENSPLVIFIARDHHYKMPYFSSLKLNDKIKVRVIGQRFELEDTYISVIAELIEPYTEKIKRPKIILPEDEEDDEAINKEDEKKYLSTRPKTKRTYKEKTAAIYIKKPFDKFIINYNIRNVKHTIDYSLFSVSESSKKTSIMPWELKQIENFYEDLFDYKIKNITLANANVGVDSIFLSKLFPEAIITSIEEDDDEFNNLTTNIKNFNLEDKIIPIKENLLYYIESGRWWFEDYSVGNFIKLDPSKFESSDNKSFIYLNAPYIHNSQYAKDKNKVVLNFKTDDGTDVEIMEIADYLFKTYKTSYVIVNIPTNYDFDNIYIHFNILKEVNVMDNYGEVSHILLCLVYDNDLESIDKKDELIRNGKFDEFKEFIRKNKQDSKKNKESISEYSKSNKFDDVVLKYDINDVENKIDYNLFSISESSKYSSLMPWHLKQVETFYKDLFEDKIFKIIDATANIGVDTIFFSKLFPDANIISYEIMEDEFNNLIKNIKAFDLDHRIRPINSAFGYDLDSLPDEDPSNKSFIYIDAPWGGPDYNKIENLALFLDEEHSPNMNILEITKFLLLNNKTSYVILKVPRNYEFNNIPDIFDIVKRSNIMRNNTVSFVLIVLTLKADIIKK